MKPDKEVFYKEVYGIVAEIPAGKVLSYGDIAALAGWPNHSRMVGRVLREVPESAGLPCHRVVNASGRIAPGWDYQRELLLSEGVSFRPGGCVDLKKHRWNIGEESAL